MIMNGSTCRRMADQYKKRAETEHYHAQRHFRSNEYELAVESAESAMFYDNLVLRYERLAHQRQGVQK